jgi:protocatechuate 3,4-dioxygenase beta subunit
MNRRDLLSWMGAAGAGWVAGSVDAQSHPTFAAPNDDAPACILTPKQIEGPYFVEKHMNRSDIRRNLADGTVKKGVQLVIVLRVYGNAGGRCTPLEDAIVDIWHCDALGVYSDVIDREYNTVGKSFLRGYQVTDSKGEVHFTTVFPGQYEVRATHIHVKVRTKRGFTQDDFNETARIVKAAGVPAPSDMAGAGPLIRHEFTTQLYLDDETKRKVYATAPYSEKRRPEVTNDSDIFFKDGGRNLIMPLMKTAAGYTGAYTIGIQFD